MDAKLSGQRIREKRMQKRMQQKELASAIGVRPSSLCAMERGLKLPALDRLVRMVEVLDTTADYLLCGKPETIDVFGKLWSLTPEQRRDSNGLIGTYILYVLGMLKDRHM